jgi:hypothetical protein
MEDMKSWWKNRDYLHEAPQQNQETVTPKKDKPKKSAKTVPNIPEEDPLLSLKK